MRFGPWSKRSWKASHQAAATIAASTASCQSRCGERSCRIRLDVRTAERTTSTTRSCVSAGIPGQSGSEKFSVPACSVAGSEPGSYPRKRSDGWRWSGVV